MKFTLTKALLWLAAYVILALSPLLVAYAANRSSPRPFWIEFSVGLGFVGLAIMGLQFVLTGRFKNIASSLGLDSMLQFHRKSGLIAFFFILAHPFILIAYSPIYLTFLNPGSNLPRALALSTVLAALVLLIVTTLWRRRVGLSYEWWRAGHGFLALFVVFIGLVHILQVGFYVSTWWKQVIWIGMTVGAMAFLINTRVIRPMMLWRNLYRVSEIREERSNSYTLVLSAEGHPGMRFSAGQFVWLTLGESPFSMQQHPFSISSSPLQPERIELTIKELGDFTSTVKNVKIGTCAFIEGPYGAFTLDTNSSKGLVFLVGGVGITPVMSILRTLQETKDGRPLMLIYGSRDIEGTLFLDELKDLASVLDLEIIHVLQDPPAGWAGESGLIDKEIVNRNLPEEPAEFDYYVCGPEPMMDFAETYLRQSGVPMRQIFSERFNIV